MQRVSAVTSVSVPPPVREYYVDPDEAALFLKVDRRTVTRWAREGHIPAHPLDLNAERKDWRFLLSELDRKKRQAQTKVVQMALPKKKAAEVSA